MRFRELERPSSHSLASLSGASDRDIKVKGWPDTLGWVFTGHRMEKDSTIALTRHRPARFFYLDRMGNARLLWQYKGTGGYTWGIPSPDGRYLATLNIIFNSNVWMLEGF